MEAHVVEADLALRHRERLGVRPSTTLVRAAIVSMPSWTTPMFSKMPATTHRIQPDMPMMRMHERR